MHLSYILSYTRLPSNVCLFRCESQFFSSKPKPKRTRRTRARLGGAVCVPVSKTSERDHALHMLCSLDGAAHPTSADNRHRTAALTSPVDPVLGGVNSRTPPHIVSSGVGTARASEPQNMQTRRPVRGLLQWQSWGWARLEAPKQQGTHETNVHRAPRVHRK